jgi:hypothetical protein
MQTIKASTIPIERKGATMPGEPTKNRLAEQESGAAQNQDPAQVVRLDDGGVAAVYANFCRISGTFEEVVLDFAMNAHPPGTAPESLKLNQRVVMNFYTAKRLLGALAKAVQAHEQAFGVLETDVRKRFHPQQRNT